MAQKKKTLELWINEALNDPDKEGRKCTILSLVHVEGRQEKEVHTVKFGSQSWEPTKLAKLFKGKAEVFSQELNGPQQFRLHAFYEGDEAEATYPFLVEGQLEYGDGLTEGPTEKGLTSQAMRHTEAMVQLAFKHTAMVMGQQAELLEKYVQMNNQLIVENKDAINGIKELILEKVTNDHGRRLELIRESGKTEERKKLIGFIPALANTILGREVFPQSSADTSLIETIADSLEEKDIIKLAEFIKPEMMGPLMNRFGNYLEGKRKKREEANKMLEDVNPEDDAAGD
jgi:hypothetical protein